MFLLLLLLLGCGHTYVFGLRPIYPSADDPRVDSLQPTLRWEAFPIEGDSRPIQDVTYELRIYDAVGEAVYEKTGLTAPSHRLTEPLHPAAEYVWTVRARHTLGGNPRVTQWSRYAPQAKRSGAAYIPSGQGYELETEAK